MMINAYITLFYCTASRPGLCVAWGDPHYMTYDRSLLHYQGTCTYLLTGTCDASSLPAFSVRVKNEHRYGNDRVSYVKMLQVTHGDVKITLRKGRKVMVSHFTHDGATVKLIQ